MTETVTPAMLEELLEYHPEALSSDATLPSDILDRYPGARRALDELRRLVKSLEDTLTPVRPRAEFVRELKFALIQAPTPDESPSSSWFPRRSLQVAGAVAIGAGLWYIAVRRRNRNEPDTPAPLTNTP